jgi:hypothetical protein
MRSALGTTLLWMKLWVLRMKQRVLSFELDRTFPEATMPWLACLFIFTILAFFFLLLICTFKFIIFLHFSIGTIPSCTTTLDFGFSQGRIASELWFVWGGGDCWAQTRWQEWRFAKCPHVGCAGMLGPLTRTVRNYKM